MSNLKKFLALGLAFVLTLGVSLTFPTPAPAQDAYGAWMPRLLGAPAASRYVGDDQDVVLVLKYVGATTTGGTVTIESDGNITLKTGPVGSSSADTTVECPVSGALGGIIDVSDTACDTLGEVADIINTSTSNWRAVIVDGLRSDSSNDVLNALSESAGANSADGLALVRDTSVALTQTIALVPSTFRTIQPYLQRTISSTAAATTPRFNKEPFRGTRGILFNANTTSTYASGTSIVSILCRVPKFADGLIGSDTVTTLYSYASGATTAEKAVSWPYGFLGCNDGVLMVRLTNSAAMASNSFSVHGLFMQTNN